MRFFLLLLVPVTLLSQPALRPLSDRDFWTFQRFLGSGDVHVDNTDVLEMHSSAPEGMAATVRGRKIAVEPSRRYRVVMEIKTEGLRAVTAKLTGGAYVYFWDERLLPGSFQPTPGTLAPPDSNWHETTLNFTTPTTARTAELHLAYAAYGGYVSGLYPRQSGTARGKLWIRNVRIEPGEKVPALASTMHVSHPTIQAGIDTATESLHNAQLSGMFTVGDGYTISGNIVPDLSFGLFGVRRLAHPRYLDIMKNYWKLLGSQMSADGKIPQRVMSQVFFPLGVDEIFSYDGDLDFLASELPHADRALDYVAKRADSDGLARLVDYGKWRMGEGADWVDWYPTRMEGKTFNFHQWYVRALRRCAALHEEFAGKAAFASAQRAQQYRIRAGQVEKSLRRMYWYEDHFVTNIDYGGQIADQKWLDDHVWAIRFGIATADQARQIWGWIDADPSKHEGTPTRWAAFLGPVHGPLTWFGRLGAGDILARYRSGNPRRGMELLERISEIFARDHNVYEAYDMYGNIVPGTRGWGNYTEHCGGYLWAVLEGPFGIDFESDGEAAATVRPQFPPQWSRASTDVFVRGSRIAVSYTRNQGKSTLALASEDAPQSLRVILTDGSTRLVRVGKGTPRTFSY